MTLNHISDGTDFHAAFLNGLVNAHGAEAIISGCAPSKGTGNYDVDIASGTAFITGTGEVSVGSATKTLTTPGNDADLDAGEARVDLISVDSTGTVNVAEGTAASGNKKPIGPDIPSGEALIAIVFVDGAGSSLSSSDIFDYRTLLNDDKERYLSTGSHTMDAGDLGGSGGTSGQVLESNGTVANWADLSTGMTPIETQTPSAASTADFTTSFGNHEAHVFYLHNVIPASDSVNLHLRTSTDAGMNWDSASSDYSWAVDSGKENGSADNSGAATDTEVQIGGVAVGSAASEGGVSGAVRVYGTGLADETHLTYQVAFTAGDGQLWISSGAGKRAATEDVTGVRFLFSSGNIESGTIEHLGVN